MKLVNESLYEYNCEYIIKDILNENIASDVLGKIKEYGKKGLLTAAILLTLAGTAQAQNKAQAADVLKTGIEYVNDKSVKTDIYSALTSLAAKYTSFAMQERKIEEAGGFKEVRLYYQNLRDGKTPQQLSEMGKKCAKIILNSMKKFDNNMFNELIQDGKIIK